MKLIKLIPVLFFGLLFVLPVATEAKSRHSEFFESEGDRDPPFVCRQIKDPNLNLSKRRNGFSATSLLETGVEYNENTLVILAVPSDKEDGTDFSEKEKEAREAVFDAEKSAKNYFLKISGNIMELIGNVFNGWVVLPETAEKYGVGDIDKFNNKKILKAVIEAVDGSVDFRNYGRIIIFTRGQQNFAYSSIGQWSNIETDDGELSLSICWIGEEDIGSRYLLWHEIFHTKGAEHSGSIVLGSDDSCDRLCLTQDITKGEDGGWPPVKCTTYEYWNSWSIMGSGIGYPFMHDIDKLWPDDSRVYEPKESGYVTLIPRSSSKEGFKMISFEGKDDQGSKITICAEYYAKVEGTFDISGDKSYLLLYFSDEDGELNGDSTILFREEIEKDGKVTYNPLTSFCDSQNGLKIELLGEYGEGESATVELQITLDKSATATPVHSSTPTLAPSPSLDPTPTLIPLPTPIPTPSLNPTLPPAPTPEPTVTSEEMVLSVTINGQDATNNDVVVARKSWVNVAVEVSGSGGEVLQADKISCELTKSNGKKVYKNRPNGVFRFKVGRRGEYSLEVEVSKDGFQTASFQAKFKVE